MTSKKEANEENLPAIYAASFMFRLLSNQKETLAILQDETAGI
jgi:hypothetical protein